jgi:MFS family permease
LLQRLALYLGHPSYSTTVVLGALLVGAGLGSSLVTRIPERGARIAAALVPVTLLATAVPLIGPIARLTLAAPFAARVAICVVTLLCAGLAMGLLFPLGMARFDDRNRSWYWAINGAASVLGSVLALAAALVVGFSFVLWCAIVFYIGAALMLPSGTAGVRDSGA